MARPQKKGLDYFPLDVDFLNDEKLLALQINHGAESVAVFIALLCAVYRNGYYVRYDEILLLKIAKDVGAQTDLVEKTINTLIKYDFFNKKIFDEQGVLTSEAIQRRYRDAARRKRLGNNLPFWLIPDAGSGVSADNKAGYCSNNMDNYDKNAAKERKEKESKVKESKEDDDEKKEPSPPSSSEDSFSETIEKIRLYYNRRRGSMAECLKINAGTKTKIKRLLCEFTKEDIQKVIDAASVDDWCQRNRKGFIVNFSYLMERVNFERMLQRWDSLREQSLRRQRQQEEPLTPPPKPSRAEDQRKIADNLQFVSWMKAHGYELTDKRGIDEYMKTKDES